MEASLELEQFCAVLASTRQMLLEAIRAIPEEKLSWSPSPSASSVEAILRHLVAWETYFLSVIVKGDGRETERTRQKGTGRENLLRELEEIRARTLRVIQRLGPQDLDAPRRLPAGDSTIRQILLRLLRHEHYHLGQINYIYLLLHPQATGEALPPPPP